MIIVREGQAQIQVIDNAFEPGTAQRTWSPIAFGETVATVLPSKVAGDGSWVVIEEGRVLTPEVWATHRVRPNVELICYPRMRGSVGRMIAGAVLITIAIVGMIFFPGFSAAWWTIGMMGVGMIVGGAVELIMGTPKPASVPSLNNGDQGGSPTFGFGGMQNSTRIGAPIPVVYGTHKIGGQIIGIFVKTRNDIDTLDMLIAVSEGDIAGITDVRVNAQPIANFSSAVYDTRLGGNIQTTIPFFGDTSTVTISSNAILTTTFSTYTTNGTDLTAFEVKIEFPGGLFDLDGNGNFTGRPVIIEVQYKLHSAGGYTTGPTVTYTEAVRSYLRRIIRVDGLAAGQYDIQVRRTNAETASPRAQDQCYRAAVNEITSDRFTYPNVALVAMQAVATNQLSGGMPTVTCVVQGRLIRVFSTLHRYSKIYSNNPAWVVLDMLTSERYGLGRFIAPTIYSQGTIAISTGNATMVGTGTGWTATNVYPGDKLVVDASGQYMTVLSLNVGTQTITFTATWTNSSVSGVIYALRRDDLDIQSFITWANFCNELVSKPGGGTEVRCQVDIVFDSDNQVTWDAIIKVCGLGLAMPIMMGNYLKIKIEKAATPVQLFSMGNIVKESFEEIFLPLKSRSNIFQVDYMNGANDYQRDMIVIEDPLIFTNSEPPRRSAVSIIGTTRASEAARKARMYQNVNRYMTRTISFEVGLDAVACEPGDVINFQHDIPQWGYGGRCETRNRFQYSEQLSNGAAWLFVRSSSTANATVAPDTANTADKLVEDATATNTHYQYQNNVPKIVPGETYTASVYAKAAERSIIRIQVQSGDGLDLFRYEFDLTAVTATVRSNTGTGSAISATITSVGSGWYRCTATGVISTTDTDADMLLMLQTGTNVITYTGDGASGLYVWGAQLEHLAGATTYQPTTPALIYLDQEVPMIPGTSYEVLVRHNDDTTELKPVLNNVTRITSNDSFESGSTGWELYNGGPEAVTGGVVTTPAPYDGVNMWQTSWAVPNTSWKGVALLSSTINPVWVAFASNVISFYAKVTAVVTPTSCGMNLRWNTSPVSQVALVNPNLSTEWQRYVFVITWGVSFEASGRLFISILLSCNANDLFIDAVQISDGTRLTGFHKTSELTATSDFSTMPARDEVLAYGPAGVSSKPFRIVGIQRTQELTAKITAIEYNTNVYNDAATNPVPVLNYSSLANPAIAPDPVKNLTLLLQDQTLQSVWVSFTPPGSPNFKCGNIYRLNNGAYVLLGSSQTGSFSIVGIPAYVSLTIVVTSVSVTGVESSLSTAPSVVISTGPPNIADVTGLTASYEGFVSFISWQPVAWVVDVQYEIRIGVSWDSSLVMGRTRTTRIVAAGDGLYWVAALDNAGSYSVNPASINLSGSTLFSRNVVATLDQVATAWAGTLTSPAVVNDGALTISNTDDFDTIADLDLQLAYLDFDLGLSLATGYYDIPTSEIVNLGTAKTAGVSALYAVTANATGALWDDVVSVDPLATIDGSYGSFVGIVLQISIAGNDDIFGAWQTLILGQYYAKKFKFRVVISTLDATVQPLLTVLKFIVDMPDRILPVSALAIGTGSTNVVYSPPFQSVPAVHVTIVNAVDGDKVLLTAQATTGFTIQITNGGAGVARTINWSAHGY